MELQAQVASHQSQDTQKFNNPSAGRGTAHTNIVATEIEHFKSSQLLRFDCGHGNEVFVAEGVEVNVDGNPHTEYRSFAKLHHYLSQAFSLCRSSFPSWSLSLSMRLCMVKWHINGLKGQGTGTRESVTCVKVLCFGATGWKISEMKYLRLTDRLERAYYQSFQNDFLLA